MASEILSCSFIMQPFFFVLRVYNSIFSVYLCLFATDVCCVILNYPEPPQTQTLYRAQMSQELEKLWILYPKARDHYTQHFKVPCPLSLLAFHQIVCPLTETTISLILASGLQSNSHQISLHWWHLTEDRTDPVLIVQVLSKIKVRRFLLFYSLYCLLEKVFV